MKNYFLLLMLCLSGIAITSCSPPQDIIYFQDLTTTHPIEWGMAITVEVTALVAMLQV